MVAAQQFTAFSRRITRNKKSLVWILLLSLAIWAALYPQRFIQLWLTPDQQGQILFDLDYYPQAAQKFQNSLWKGVSFYAAEEFETAATLFSQYPDVNGLLARANALAHSRNYINAVQVYKQLLDIDKENFAAIHNSSIVQALIDGNQSMSESQQGEAGEMFVDDESGPKSSEGDERMVFDATPKEQLTADQLLQDPALTEMWMRQVQKDPTQFLKIKFYMQLEQRASATTGEGEK